MMLYHIESICYSYGIASILQKEVTADARESHRRTV